MVAGVMASGPASRLCVAVMARGGRLVVESRVDPGERWALGRVHLGVLQPAAQLAGDGPVRVLFHGDLHNEAQLQSTLQELGEPRSSGAAAIVGALYRHKRLDPRALSGRSAPQSCSTSRPANSF